jgi:multidrug resistance efflux pump
MRWSRLIKVVAGSIIVSIAGYLLIGERLAGTSADAVVNARVLYVRAAIDGELTLEQRNLGSRIAKGALIGNILDPRPEDVRLLELQREEAVARAEVQRLEAKRAGLEDAVRELSVQSDLYRRGRLSQLDAQLAEAKSAADAAEARYLESMRVMERLSGLNQRGIETSTNLDRARVERDVRMKELEQGRLRITFLRVERDAAKNGTFLGDSFNDAPYSEQRIREIKLTLRDIEAAPIQQTSLVELFDKQVAVERLRNARLGEATIVAPVDGILWEAMSGSGEYVRKGQDLLELIDCTSSIVTASVSERLYNSLAVGDPARFRLLGERNVFEGSIIRLAGPGAQGVYSSLAIGPSEEHLTRFDVAIAVPQLANETLLACGVGRTGRVMFAAAPPDFWRELLYRAGF